MSISKVFRPKSEFEVEKIWEEIDSEIGKEIIIYQRSKIGNYCIKGSPRSLYEIFLQGEYAYFSINQADSTQEFIRIFKFLLQNCWSKYPGSYSNI